MYKILTNQRLKYISHHQNDTFILNLTHIYFSLLLLVTMARGFEFNVHWNCQGLSPNRQELELLDSSAPSPHEPTHISD